MQRVYMLQIASHKSCIPCLLCTHVNIETQVQSNAYPCAICGGHSHIGTGFLSQYFIFPLSVPVCRTFAKMELKKLISVSVIANYWILFRPISIQYPSSWQISIHCTPVHIFTANFYISVQCISSPNVNWIQSHAHLQSPLMYCPF